MGYLYRRQRIWYVAWKKDGHWKRESSRSRHKDIAAGLLRQRQRQAALGEEEPISIPLLTFANQALRLERATRPKKAWQRSTAIAANLTGRQSPLFGKFVHELTSGLLSRFVQTRSTAGARPGTILKEINWLRALLTEAARQGHIARTAVAMIRDETSVKRLPALRRASQRRTRVLLPREIPVLFRAIGNNVNLRAAVTLALRHGLREGNIQDLIEDQIDFSVEPAVLRYPGDEMKNEDPLLVWLCPEIRAVLWERWQGIPTRKIFRDFKSSWKRALTRSRLRDFHFHDLRRTYITFRLAAGIDPKSVQSEVGHRDSRMTMDCYGVALKDPSLRTWAMQHFRFPWDPPLVAAPVGTTHWTTQLTGRKTEDDVSS